MSITRLKYLFYRFINRTGTPEETDEFLAMIKQTHHDDEMLALLNEYWNESTPVMSLSPEKAERIFNHIVAVSKSNKTLKGGRFLSYKRLAMAASIVVICGLSMFFYQLRPESEGTGKSYFKTAAKKNKPLRRFVNLPDGSYVILNENSKIEYGSKFRSGGKREVYLTGEAYFDIKHDDEHPFIVHTGDLQVTVLGTAFNVNDDPENETVTVTVTRGRVRVGDSKRAYGEIIPNQQIVYNKVQNVHILKQVKAQQIVEWKNEDLYFDDVSIGDIASQLKERFHVTLVFSKEAIKNCRFSATFLKTQKLEQILNVIAEFNQLSYKFQDKSTVLLTGTGCN